MGREYYNKFINMKQAFPDTKGDFPYSGWVYQARRIVLVGVCLDKDWELALTLCEEAYTASTRGMAGLMVPITTHLEAFHSNLIEAVIMMYNYTIVNGNADRHRIAMKEIRKSIELYAKFSPGVFRCGLQVYVARITLLLKDRPFYEAFASLEKALAYSLELEVLPNSTMILQAEIARWKGDIDALSKIVKKYE